VGFTAPETGGALALAGAATAPKPRFVGRLLERGVELVELAIDSVNLLGWIRGTVGWLGGPLDWF
jgi:hypothetical protein